MVCLTNQPTPNKVVTLNIITLHRLFVWNSPNGFVMETGSEI